MICAAYVASSLLVNMFANRFANMFANVCTINLIIGIFLFMAPRWHQGTIAPRALKKNKKRMFGKNNKSTSLFLGRFKGLGGHGSMQEPLEIVTASRMQNMMELRKKNTYFVTILLF